MEPGPRDLAAAAKGCHHSGDPALFGGHLVRRRVAGEAARHRDGLLGFWSHVPQKPEHMPDKAEAK